MITTGIQNQELFMEKMSVEMDIENEQNLRGRDGQKPQLLWVSQAKAWTREIWNRMECYLAET